MTKRPKTGGRQKGTPNRVTTSARAALLEAFDQLGGTSALVAWARAEPSQFYKLWGRLVPHQVEPGETLAPGFAELMEAAQRRTQNFKRSG